MPCSLLPVDNGMDLVLRELGRIEHGLLGLQKVMAFHVPLRITAAAVILLFVVG